MCALSEGARHARAESRAATSVQRPHSSSQASCSPAQVRRSAPRWLRCRPANSTGTPARAAPFRVRRPRVSRLATGRRVGSAASPRRPCRRLLEPVRVHSVPLDVQLTAPVDQAHGPVALLPQCLREPADVRAHGAHGRPWDVITPHVLDRCGEAYMRVRPGRRRSESSVLSPPDDSGRALCGCPDRVGHWELAADVHGAYRPGDPGGAWLPGCPQGTALTKRTAGRAVFRTK
jgi:hypothetical protein